MILLRRAADRGIFDHGWLQSAHTFSFADYHDPRHMHYRTLRVLNEDVIQKGQGFGMHPHRDMEILTWILSGALRHEDDLGHREVLRQNEVQVMSAGTGVQHSEHNASDRDPVHLLQIWILPERRGLPPRYEQRSIDRAALRAALPLLAAPPGSGGMVTVHQDVNIHATELVSGQQVALRLRPGRSAWVQVARGSLQLDSTRLDTGDGAAVADQDSLTLTGLGDGPAEALIFDLA